MPPPLRSKTILRPAPHPSRAKARATFPQGKANLRKSTAPAPIFITAFPMVAGKLGIKSIYRCVAPIVVYYATLVFLIILQKVKMAMKSK